MTAVVKGVSTPVLTHPSPTHNMRPPATSMISVVTFSPPVDALVRL